MQINYRVSLDFTGYGDADLDEFADNVATSLTGNASFPVPPMPPPALNALVLGYHAAIGAALPGGIQLTAAKNAARELVLDALRKDANYVQTLANHDLAMLLTSGYYATSTNRAQLPLDKPVIALVDNAAATQLLVRLNPVTNAKAFQMQTGIGAGAWQEAGMFTQSRRIVLQSLASGTVYNVRARAIGGSTGYSDWSDPLSHIVT
jgi:hypothetical protein